MRKFMILAAISLASLTVHAAGITVPDTGLSLSEGNALLKQIVDEYTAESQDLANQGQVAKSDHDRERARLIDAIRACAGDATCAANQEAALKDLERKYNSQVFAIGEKVSKSRSDATENSARVVVSVFFEALNDRLQTFAQTKQIDIVSLPVLSRSENVDCKMAVCWANSGVGTSQSHFVFLDNQTQKVVDVGLLFSAGQNSPEYFPALLTEAKNDGAHILGLATADIDSLIQRLRTKGAVYLGVGMTTSVNGGADLKSDAGVLVGSQSFF